MNRLTTMNDDDYKSRLLLYLSFLLQRIIAASSIISTTRRSFFSFWRGQYGKRTYAHSRTHSTHHSPLIKKHFGFFFFLKLFVLFVFWHTILLLLLPPLLDSAGHFVCSVSISVCHVVYYFIIFCGLHRIPGS